MIGTRFGPLRHERTHAHAHTPPHHPQSQVKVASCQLLTGQDDECQLGHSQLREDLVKFRLFLPELVLRLRLAADFRPLVRLACYWLMACALLEIALFLLAATRLQWRRLRAKGLQPEAILEQELLVGAFLVGWHELLSYLVHYLYYDSHTLCDGSGLFFRDAMALYTLVQVITTRRLANRTLPCLVLCLMCVCVCVCVHARDPTRFCVRSPCMM